MKHTPHGDDIPPEIDFSNGERGKFFQANAELKLPVYLDNDVQIRLTALADARGMDISRLVDELVEQYTR